MKTATNPRDVSRTALTYVLVAAMTTAAGPLLTAQGQGRGNRPEIASRARGAERVVVARIAAVEPMAVTNEFGDQLIISRTTLLVEEILKGRRNQTITLDVEGGVLGDLKLTVSDLPTVETGERAVFFLSRSSSGRNVPHGRGLGILKLTDSNFVEQTTLDLETIRREVAAASQPQGR